MSTPMVTITRTSQTTHYFTTRFAGRKVCTVVVKDGQIADLLHHSETSSREDFENPIVWAALDAWCDASGHERMPRPGTCAARDLLG
jgi:hypothetical protein